MWSMLLWKRLGKSIGVFFLLGTLVVPCFGQTSQDGFVHYTVTDGLPSSEVHDVQEDDNGLLWIATDRGLCSFDGYKFKIYGLSDGMYEQTVWRILKDDYGRLWFIGLSGRLYYYAEGKFHSFEGNADIAALELGDLRMLSYSLYEGQLFIHRASHELILQTSLSTLEMSINRKETLEDSTVHVLPEDEGGIVFSRGRKFNSVIWDDKVVAYENGQKIGAHLNSAPFFLDDAFLLAIPNQLLLVSKKTAVAKRLFEGNHINSMERDVSGNLNVCTKNMVLRLYNDKLDTFQMFDEGVLVAGYYEDHEGGHWFATINDGLYYRPGSKIKPLFREVLNTPVSSFKEYNGEVYIGAFRRGYYQIIEQGDRKYLQKKTALSFYEEEIIEYNGDYVSLRNRWVHRTNRAIILAPIMSQGKLWFCSSMKTCVIHENGEEEEIERISGMRTSDIVYFQGKWMIGTTDGLWAYKDGQIEHMKSRFDKFSGRISDLLVMDSLMYIATVGQGLLVFNGKSIRSYNTANSDLPSNYCSHTHLDTHGHFWISTTNGLVKSLKVDMDKRAPVFVTYDIKDGLSSNEVLCTISEGDDLYIGSKAGLDVMDIWTAKDNEQANYQLKVDYMAIDGQEVDLEGDMTLMSDQNDIEIGFKGICYRCLGNLEYSYRILGLSNQWNTTTQTSIDQFNLQYGDFTLELKCKGYKLAESEIVRLNFSILRPFYFQAWFFILLFIILGGIAFAIARNMLMRRKLTRKLQQYQYTTFTAQLNPHFIFNTLNAIQSLFLKREVKSGVNYMSTFGRLLRGILQNPSHELVSLKDELDLLSNYIDLERIRMRAALEYDEVVTLKEAKEQIMVPPMLLQPLVENSINHGLMPKKGGLVKVTVLQLPDKLQIEVEDDGVGFKRAKPRKSRDRPSYGLKLVRERVNLINRMKGLKCEFQVLDLNDLGTEGTLIKFCLPLIIDKEHK